VEVGLYDSGSWMLYYWSVCDHLDPASGKCRVHGTAQQPEVCKRYSAHECWYRRAFLPGTGTTFLRLDLPRFDWVASRVSFDVDGEIYGVPDWDAMVEGLAALPLGPVPTVEPGTACTSRVALRVPALTLATDLDPCRVLWSPLRAPESPGDLDMVAFRLGFRGVELALGEHAWGLLLRAECGDRGSPRCPRAGSPAVMPAGRTGAAATGAGWGPGCGTAGLGEVDVPPARFLRLGAGDFGRVRDRLFHLVDSEGRLPSLRQVRRIFAGSEPTDDDGGGRPRRLSA
jgi:hypothetical protein